METIVTICLPDMILNQQLAWTLKPQKGGLELDTHPPKSCLSLA